MKTRAGKIAIAGASGTIGRAVARTLIEDGYDVLAIVRDPTAKLPELSGARVKAIRSWAPDRLAALFAEHQVSALISCIASRSGSPRDAKAVDYKANLDLLRACEAAGVDHFILLSAICVQRPKLAFQHAKLAFERALIASDLTHTIVRPTAFFKSLSGQVARVAKGRPFLLFGDGELTRCKPISDRDLARFIVDCLAAPERQNAIMPIGGPGPAISLKQQGEILFRAAGQEPKFRSVPVAMFTAAAAALSLGARWSRWFAEKAEYARIARYYAMQSMLVLDPETGEYNADATPEFGSDRLIDHYAALLEEHR